MSKSMDLGPFVDIAGGQLRNGMSSTSVVGTEMGRGISSYHLIFSRVSVDPFILVEN